VAAIAQIAGFKTSRYLMAVVIGHIDIAEKTGRTVIQVVDIRSDHIGNSCLIVVTGQTERDRIGGLQQLWLRGISARIRARLAGKTGVTFAGVHCVTLRAKQVGSAMVRAPVKRCRRPRKQKYCCNTQCKGSLNHEFPKGNAFVSLFENQVRRHKASLP